MEKICHTDPFQEPHKTSISMTINREEYITDPTFAHWEQVGCTSEWRPELKMQKGHLSDPWKPLNLINPFHHSSFK